MEKDAVIRPIRAEDIEACGQVLYRSFRHVAESHGFPPELPTLAYAMRVAVSCAMHPATYGVVAVLKGELVGSGFIDQRDQIFGIGPVSVDVELQGSGIGRRLMEVLMDKGRKAAGIRLVQDAFNTLSLGLYASLGLAVKQPLAQMNGRPRSRPAADVKVRPMTKRDLKSCADLYLRVHGVRRINESRDALRLKSAFVLVRDGRIRAYTTGLAYWGHGAAETTKDMQDLILGAETYMLDPLNFIVPLRQAELFRWCLDQGLRLVKPMNMMATGLYQEPRGCFFPSAIY
jgi:predicted N-acetyltransferase YhbS